MPATSPPATQGSKSIFTSRTFAGLALVAVPLIAQRFGYKLGDAETTALVEQVFQAVGLLVAAWGRLRASKTISLIPESGNRKPESGGSESGHATPALLALLVALTGFALLSDLYLTGCASTTRQGRVTNAVLLTAGKFAGKVLISSVANMASDKAKGLQIDYAQSASAGLWANMDSVITSGDIERIVNAYAGPAAPALAVPLAAQFEAASPRDAADRAAVVWALAAGLDSAAGRLAPSEGKAIVPLLP
jgi:hypothetical protein